MLHLDGVLLLLQLRDAGLGSGNGIRQFLNALRQFSLILVDEPLTDQAAVLLDLPLLTGDGHGDLGLFRGLPGLIRGDSRHVLSLVSRHSGHILRLTAQFLKKRHRKRSFHGRSIQPNDSWP